jgi:hypothetical protein
MDIYIVLSEACWMGICTSKTAGGWPFPRWKGRGAWNSGEAENFTVITNSPRYIQTVCGIKNGGKTGSSLKKWNRHFDSKEETMSLRDIYEGLDFEGFTLLVFIGLMFIIVLIAIGFILYREVGKSFDSISLLKGEKQVGIIIINEREFRFDSDDSFKAATKDMNIDKYEHIIVDGIDYFILHEY